MKRWYHDGKYGRFQRDPLSSQFKQTGAGWYNLPMVLRRAQALARHFLERFHRHLWGARPRQRRSTLERNLVLLHDTLDDTRLAGRYWLWGGVLLGWAREGRLLENETDVDLAVSRSDLHHFRDSVADLESAGFRLNRAFVNNRGEITQYIFLRNFMKFEFFILDDREVGADYWLYYPPHNLELFARIPPVTLAPMRFLDRTWLKPADHDAHLTSVYGDWRTPHSDYWYVRDEKSIVSRHAWTGSLLWAPRGAEIR